MRTLLLGLSWVALTVASGCTTGQGRNDPEQGVAVHACTKNPFFRASGLFGGAPLDIFLSGPDIRTGPPPAAGSLTRVLNVTRVDNLGDPGAEPVIDKCGSWLKAIGEDEVEVTIMWDDRNCPDSFDADLPSDCRSRARFRFSRSDLGIEEVLGRVEDREASIQRLLVIDAYFTQEIQPTGRHSATGMPLPARAIMHLVVRAIRLPTSIASGAATAVDAIRTPRSY